MRSFGCIVYIYIGDVLTKSSSVACWSMLRYPAYFSQSLSGQTDKFFAGKDIYIAEFDYPLTAPYQCLLFSVINQITPCSLTTINDVQFIKYRMLSTYDQNLILLSFIRNLWYEPVKEYTLKFFEALEKSNSEEDPLVRLTTANKEACGCSKSPYGQGHCNFYPQAQLKIKNTSQLLKYNGTSTSVFLCS